jgi:hypothetical protein
MWCNTMLKNLKQQAKELQDSINYHQKNDNPALVIGVVS